MEQNRNRVAKIVQMGGGTLEDAQTILHDAVLDVISIMEQGKYDPKRAHHNTLLFRIAQNKWLDELKRRHPKNGREIPLDQVHISPQSTQMNFIEEKEKIQKIASAIEQLEPKDRALIEQKYHEGKKLKEIALAFEETETTLKKRHERCKAKLKKILGKDPRID